MPARMNTSPFPVLVILSLLPAWGASAQLSSAVTGVSTDEGVSRSSVTVTASLRDGHAATTVLLLYRPFGTREFRRAEMDLRGSSASSVIPPASVIPPFIEYYLVLADAAGHREAYPRSATGDPLVVPPPQLLRITVREAAEEQILFLSPDPDEVLSADDVLISISLLRADTAVVQRATQIKLDEANVTKAAVFSGDLIILAPENLGIRLSPGRHTVKVGLFNRMGRLHATSARTFFVRRSGKETLLSSTIPQRRFDYNATLQVESRHENISSTGIWYNRASAQFNGRTDVWKFNGNLFLTSDEKSDRQPQHRYFIGVETPWITAGYGDHYPALPELVLNGKRVRGLQTNARYGIFGLDLSLGEITRGVEGTLLSSFPADSLTLEFLRDSTAAFDQINSTTWGKFSYGTYARRLFAVRPSIGNRKNWEVGFSWLSSGDDLGSIRNGTKPQENILLGTDFMARFDNNRVELTGQAALTAYNADISSGNFTDAYIDSVYKSNPGTIKAVRDILTRFITVNDNLRPLSLERLSTLAYQFGVGLEYFNNAFRATYLFRGSDYTSFGQSFLQTDIRGIQLTDRARLLDDQMFLTLGFERLEDNTAKTKAATTVYSNINVAATWFSRRDLPTVTAGFSRYSNDNSLSAAGPDSLSAILDATLRLYLQTSYDFQLAARHTATLSLSTSKRSDETVRKYDLASFSGEAGLTTQYAIPLQTVVSIGVHRNTIPSSESRGRSIDWNYTALSLVGRYTLISEVLTLTGAIAPTFGDYRRTAADLGVEWSVRPDMSFQLQGTYFHTDDGMNDSIVNLRYRVTI